MSDKPKPAAPISLLSALIIKAAEKQAGKKP
jgi:hypothetical protein